MMIRLAWKTVLRNLLRKAHWPSPSHSGDGLRTDVDRYGVAMFLFGVMLPLLAFAALAGHAQGLPLKEEKALLFALHRLEATLLDHIALVSSMLVTVVALAVLAWLLIRRCWRTAFFWLIAVGGAAIINSLVKKAVRRDRPLLWDLVAPHGSFSFPSGHAMQSMAIAVALIVLFRCSPARWRVALLGAAGVLSVGICRMYLGLHYPTDILAGWLLSLAWVTALAMLFDRRYLALPQPRVTAFDVASVSSSASTPTAVASAGNENVAPLSS